MMSMNDTGPTCSAHRAFSPIGLLVLCNLLRLNSKTLLCRRGVEKILHMVS